MKSSIASASAGTAGVTYPLWADWLSFFDAVNEVVIATFGLAVLILTIWAKVLDVRIKKHQLNGLNSKPPKA